MVLERLDCKEYKIQNITRPRPFLHETRVPTLDRRNDSIAEDKECDRPDFEVFCMMVESHLSK
jgi:hypothetical protein